MEFHPYSKADQLRSHQKEKDTPKYKPQRHGKNPKKKKKVETYKGVKIPSRGQRSEFSTKHKKQIIDYFGGDWQCAECMNNSISFHHAQFRTAANGLGRNNPRNGIPLCDSCHRKCHLGPNNKENAQIWRERQASIWGEHYFRDRFDLWKMNLIERPTEELMERFFQKEAERLDSQGD